VKIDPKDKPLLLALLTLAFGLGLNAVISLAEHPNPKGANGKNEDPYEIPKLILETLEACATVGIAGYAVLQYSEGRKSSERQLRAYMCIDTVTGAYDDAGLFSVEVKLTNAGQTPAYKADNWTAIGFRVVPPDRGMGPGESRTPHSVMIGPGLHKTNSVSRIPTPTEIELMQAKKGAIFVWGRMDYIDAFGEPRWTEFRTYTFETSGRGIGMRNHPDGNEAT